MSAAPTESTTLTAISATKLRLHTNKMSPSSTGDSPHSASGGTASAVRPYPIPSRENFTIEVPSQQLTSGTNGTNAIKSPTSLKGARTPSFSREGILGSAQKARNLSQSSENRPDAGQNGTKQEPSDDGSNPLKRRNTDAGVDYPRRRATIAVRRKSSGRMRRAL